MNIQKALKKNRYGEMNIKAPNKYDLDDYGLKTTHLRKPVFELFDKVIYQLRNPPKRDRYYNHYIYTVEKYMEYLESATKQSQYQSMGQIINIHLAGKLLYMNEHPGRFHEFVQFKYSWLYNMLCAMRTYIIGRMYFLGEIGSNRTIESWTCWFENYPKPMGNQAMSLLADNIYDIIQPRCDLIKVRSAKLRQQSV